MIKKIVSGGQTGADRGALDAALKCGIEIGGWVPKGRLAEDGIIPEKYMGLQEAPSKLPAVRTTLNVRDSDATLIVSRGPLTGGSLLTYREASRLKRPVLHIDLLRIPHAKAVGYLRVWLQTINPATLNVAGPRASRDRTIGRRIANLLQDVLAESQI
jgi:hypothetical protein